MTTQSTIQLLELKDFKNVHILNRVLKYQPYIYYPISKDITKRYNLVCVKHYFETNINLWKFEFINKILYSTNNTVPIIRLMNNKLRKGYNKNLQIFNDISDEMIKYSGSFVDDEYDILKKRYESAQKMLCNYLNLIEPFNPVTDLSLDFETILPNRLGFSIE